jgi:carboxymethylenebutenolidase
MLLVEDAPTDLATPTGPMRTYLYRPAAEGRYPGLVLYSEIFQRTAPIKRIAAVLAGHGFLVAVPEIFHELEPAGVELAYNPADTDKGNRYKVTKAPAAHDSDTRAVIDFLRAHARCTGRLGAFGVCIGGHLAYRAAMSKEISAAACFYATDIHKGSLGPSGDDSLARTGEIKGEMLMVWGRQDPHIPQEGRAKIQARMSEAGVDFTWHEFNAQHAFLRDEGPRYDPALAMISYQLVFEVFKRRLVE